MKCICRNAQTQDNVENGRFSLFHPNGMLKQDGEVKNGQDVGVWKSYDSLGRVVEEIDKGRPDQNYP